MKVMSVFGTRPEAIKMAPVVKRLAEHAQVESVVCVTGQHRQMLDQVLSLFGIVPDLDLNVMRPGQGLNGLAARLIGALDKALEAIRPELVLVHGDTTSAFGGALSAFHYRIPIGHVEAGLRTGDLSQPWPEEMNRRFVDSVSDYLFVPTETSRANLLAENLGDKRIAVTGNTVIDALLDTVARIDGDAELKAALQGRFSFLQPENKLVLVTGHRRENFGAGFDGICEALGRLARRDDVEIVYPVHLNPNVRGPVLAKLGELGNVHLIEPLEYLPFVYLMSRAQLILTDSGGIQEEAPSLGKPVLVMREVTERPEAIAAGTVTLVGTDPERILDRANHFLDSAEARLETANRKNPYGDGRASERILEEILG